jgi:sugar-specific transcriptional regulator TrmB
MLLREFDFTESEAKVYVALLKNGASTGYEISKLSGVARSKIYNILESLLQRGAITCCQSDKSTLYQAVAIQDLTAVLRKRIDRNLVQLEQEAAKFTAPPTDEQIWHLYDWDTVKSRCLTMITEAKSHVMMQIWARELDPELETAIVQKEAGLPHVLVILYDETGKYRTRIPRLYRHGFEKDKLLDMNGHWLMITTDDHEMIYITFSDAGMTQAIYTRNADMALLAREYVYHDAYCLRLIKELPAEAAEKFGPELEGIRDVFNI